jgi:hypothetical protein
MSHAPAYQWERPESNCWDPEPWDSLLKSQTQQNMITCVVQQLCHD